MTNYDVIRVERKTAEYTVINSSVEKRAQNREKTTSRDYLKLSTQISQVKFFVQKSYTKKILSKDLRDLFNLTL